MNKDHSKLIKVIIAILLVVIALSSINIYLYLTSPRENHIFNNIIGERGMKGDKGDQGIDGRSGSKGDTGENGKPGDKGDVGPQGEPGIQGIQGLQGEQGAPGEPGQNGREIELRCNPNTLNNEWRYVGDSSWRVLSRGCVPPN